MDLLRDHGFGGGLSAKDKSALIEIANEAELNNSDIKTDFAGAIGSPTASTDTVQKMTADINARKSELSSAVNLLGATTSATDTLKTLTTAASNVPKASGVVITPEPVVQPVPKGYYDGSKAAGQVESMPINGAYTSAVVASPQINAGDMVCRRTDGKIYKSIKRPDPFYYSVPYNSRLATYWINGNIKILPFPGSIDQFVIIWCGGDANYQGSNAMRLQISVYSPQWATDNSMTPIETAYCNVGSACESFDAMYSDDGTLIVITTTGTAISLYRFTITSSAITQVTCNTLAYSTQGDCYYTTLYKPIGSSQYFAVSLSQTHQMLFQWFFNTSTWTPIFNQYISGGIPSNMSNGRPFVCLPNGKCYYVGQIADGRYGFIDMTSAAYGNVTLFTSITSAVSGTWMVNPAVHTCYYNQSEDSLYVVVFDQTARTLRALVVDQILKYKAFIIADVPPLVNNQYYGSPEPDRAQQLILLDSTDHTFMLTFYNKINVVFRMCNSMIYDVALAQGGQCGNLYQMSTASQCINLNDGDSQIFSNIAVLDANVNYAQVAYLPLRMAADGIATNSGIKGNTIGFMDMYNTRRG